MSITPKQQKVFGLSLGGEPKKVIALGVLLVVLAGVWFYMRDTTDGAAAPQTATTAKAPPALKSVADPDAPGSANARRDGGPGGPKRQGSRQALSAAVKEFRPSLKRDKDNPIDPSKTDPTIRFASLMKVQGVGMAGGGRSLFDFGSVTAAVDPTKPNQVTIKPKPGFVAYGPPILGPIPDPPPPPPPPAIPLKFYGFVNSGRSGERRAFFMENEDIYIASEGEMMKGRYKLVKIGVNSVVLEDTQFKNNQQTIKLTEEAVSAN